MRTLLTTLLVAATTPSAAFAAEGGANLLDPNYGLMFWTLLIFIILFFVLKQFAFGPITAAVEAREQRLEEMLASAQRDRDEAQRLLAEHRQQLEGARAEAQKIIADARAAGERVRAELTEQARREQQEMTERARREIENEKARAILELRREAVDLAIAGASRVVEQNLDNQSNRKLVESFLASVGPVAATSRR